MKNYYFLFAPGQPLENYFQMVVADSMEEAQEKMIETWGSYYIGGYTEPQFVGSMKKEADLKNLIPLKPIYAIEMMKVGEMKEWINRLNNILTAPGDLKGDRLLTLKSDLEQSLDFDRDFFAFHLHATVLEEIGEVI